MITATTKKGTRVNVYLHNDCEPNKGGYYCEVEESGTDYELDNFCIHPEDCNCNDRNEIIDFVRNYISRIEEY